MSESRPRSNNDKIITNSMPLNAPIFIWFDIPYKKIQKYFLNYPYFNLPIQQSINEPTFPLSKAQHSYSQSFSILSPTSLLYSIFLLVWVTEKVECNQHQKKHHQSLPFFKNFLFLKTTFSVFLGVIYDKIVQTFFTYLIDSSPGF